MMRVLAPLSPSLSTCVKRSKDASVSGGLMAGIGVPPIMFAVSCGTAQESIHLVELGGRWKHERRINPDPTQR